MHKVRKAFLSAKTHEVKSESGITPTVRWGNPPRNATAKSVTIDFGSQEMCKAKDNHVSKELSNIRQWDFYTYELDLRHLVFQATTMVHRVARLHRFYIL